jgi:hypothetical protein
MMNTGGTTVATGYKPQNVKYLDWLEPAGKQ